MNKKVTFKKRIPEPKEMEEIEMKAFEELSLGNYKRWMVPLVDDVLQEINLKKGIIADIGCGPGLLTQEFALRSRNFQVIGVDISPVALRLARKNCKGLPNVSFKIGNVSKLPFKDATFDVVVCKDSFHHFSNPCHALREMVRITRPGGVVYIQDLRRDVPQYLLRGVAPPKNTVEKLIFYSTRAAYVKEEMLRFFRDLGISKFHISTRKVTRKMKYKYKELCINIPQLKAGFQSRFSAIIFK